MDGSDTPFRVVDALTGTPVKSTFTRENELMEKVERLPGEYQMLVFGYLLGACLKPVYNYEIPKDVSNLFNMAYVEQKDISEAEYYDEVRACNQRMMGDYLRKFGAGSLLTHSKLTDLIKLD